MQFLGISTSLHQLDGIYTEQISLVMQMDNVYLITIKEKNSSNWIQAAAMERKC